MQLMFYHFVSLKKPAITHEANTGGDEVRHLPEWVPGTGFKAKARRLA